MAAPPPAPSQAPAHGRVGQSRSRGEMNRPVYPAARTFAARLEEHFAQQVEAGSRDSTAGPPLPDAPAIEALIDAAFWSSLQREEGKAPEISLAFLPPGRALGPLLLAEPLPLGPRALARLAPALQPPALHLAVCRGGPPPPACCSTHPPP